MKLVEHVFPIIVCYIFASFFSMVLPISVQRQQMYVSVYSIISNMGTFFEVKIVTGNLLGWPTCTLAYSFSLFF
jgi:hypothetical protein